MQNQEEIVTNEKTNEVLSVENLFPGTVEIRREKQQEAKELSSTLRYPDQYTSESEWLHDVD